MDALLKSLTELITAGADVVASLGALLLPFVPLAIWIGIWLFAANWEKLWPVLKSGGWIGLVLVFLVVALIWSSVAPPVDGSHHILGLKLNNFVGKFVFSTGLLCIMLLCGGVQLSGACGNWCRFEDDTAEEGLHAADHGHGHGGH